MANINTSEIPQVSKELLKAWLKKKCDNSNSVLEDPGYSQFYINNFNLTDDANLFYVDGDIDHELNIGYVGYLDETETKDPTDEVIESFVDYVPKPTSSIETNENNENISRHNIVILPGSNHSNANYLYKRLVMFADKLEPYSVPFVQADPQKPYDGECKDVLMNVDKEEFYRFLKKYSK